MDEQDENSGEFFTEEELALKIQDELQSQVVDYPISQEMGAYKIADWDNLWGNDLNPDNISIATYVRMLAEDAQVNAAATLFKLALLSQPWELKFPEGQEKPEDADEILEFLKWNLENVNRTIHFRGGLRNVLDEMLEGPMIGFAVAEPVYEYAQYKGTTKIILQKLKVLPQESIEFKSDSYGNLLEIIQTQATNGPVSLVPLEKFIVWPFMMRAGNWYGRPLLKRCYKNYYIKEFLIKKWNIFLERKAVPMFIGKTRPGNIKNLNKLLAKTNEKTTMAIDRGDEIEVVQTKAVTSQFLSAVKYHDKMIFRGMMTPTLMLDIEETGARNLAESHIKVFMWVVNKMKYDVTGIMNNMLVGLVKMNFGGVEVMPEFIIPEISSEDRDKFAAVVKELVEVGVLDPTEDWIRQRLDIPLNPEWKGPNQNLPPESTPDLPPDETNEEEDEPPKTLPPAQKQIARVDGFGIPDLTTDLAVRIEPAKIASMMDVSENLGYAQLRQYVGTFEDNFISQAEKLFEGYDETSPERYNYLSKLKKLKSPKDKKVADIILSTAKTHLQDTVDYYINRLVRVIERKTAGTKQGEELGIDWNLADSDTMKVLTERAFTSSNVLNTALLEMGKNTLITGIQSGMTVEDMLLELETVFPEYSEGRLRTIVRTNISAAANQGALEVMRDTGNFVQGVMYQAVLDFRTTEFCEDHNGDTLPINDPRVDAMTPPNHYQCRSMWVPVTILDTNIDTNTWADDGPLPQKGFGKLMMEEEKNV